jgi:DNA-binding transcriptional LysR family regulator
MLIYMEMIEVEAFLAVERAGGFTRAATELRISQPAVSRRIELLERELGAPLFERVRARAGGGAFLTEAGRAFLPFAEEAVAAVRGGAEAVRAVEGGEAGEVSLALVGTLASAELLERVRRFREVHPAVRLLLRTARSDEVGEIVRRGEADLGLRYLPDPHPALASEPAGEEVMAAVCSAESRLVDLGNGDPGATDPAALSGVPWVSFPQDPGSPTEPYGALLARTLLRAGLEDAERIFVDSLTAQKRLVEADYGVGLLPESAVEEELRLGSLRRIGFPALRAAIPVMVVRRRKAYLGRAARELLGELTRSS